MVTYGTRFPQYLSLLPQIAFWEVDEVTVFVIAFCAGYFTYKLICIAAFVITYYYIKIKKNQPRGFLQHMQYRFGKADLDGYPSFFEDHFVE